jgi:hypothetical protein
MRANSDDLIQGLTHILLKPSRMNQEKTRHFAIPLDQTNDAIFIHALNGSENMF